MDNWKVSPAITVMTVTTAGGDLELVAEDKTRVAAVLRIGAEVVRPEDSTSAEEPRIEDARLALADSSAADEERLAEPRREEARLALADSAATEESDADAKRDDVSLARTDSATDDDTAADSSMEDVMLAPVDRAADDASIPVVAAREDDDAGTLTVRRMMVL